MTPPPWFCARSSLYRSTTLTLAVFISLSPSFTGHCSTEIYIYIYILVIKKSVVIMGQSDHVSKIPPGTITARFCPGEFHFVQDKGERLTAGLPLHSAPWYSLFFKYIKYMSTYRPWYLLGLSSPLAVRLQAELFWGQQCCFCQLCP